MFSLRKAVIADAESLERLIALAGRELYRACGYVADEPFEHRLTENVAIQFIAMRKRLDDRCVGTPAPPTAR